MVTALVSVLPISDAKYLQMYKKRCELGLKFLSKKNRFRQKIEILTK